jgi:hypothetical protein
MRYLLICLLLMLNGCATYTAASTAALIVTDKSLTDHVATAVTPNGDCSMLNLVKGLYYCEIRDVSKTYNRNPI